MKNYFLSRLCIWLVALAVMHTVILARRDAPIQLAFGIMTYQKAGRSVEQTHLDFIRIMNVIYENEDNHLYVLHVDVKSEKGLLRSIHDDFCQPKSNCDYIEPRNIAWAGLTTGEMMLALMHRALEFKKPVARLEEAAKCISDDNTTTARQWEYFILAGHETVPLYPLVYIENYLASSIPGTNFINCWPVEGYDFFGQWEDNRYRLQDIAVDTFDGTLMDDFTHWQRRIPTDIKFFKSIQVVVMSVAFCKFACWGQSTRRILLYLANVKTSDEMILPTILQSSPELAKTATCDTTLHFTHWIRPGGSWHPEYLTLEHLPMLLNTTRHLFARKFSLPGVSEHLLQAIEIFRNTSVGLIFDSTISPFVPPIQRKDCLDAFSEWLPPLVREHLLDVINDPQEDESLKVVATTGLFSIEMGGGSVSGSSANTSLAVLNRLRLQRDSVESQKFIDYWNNFHKSRG